MILNTLNLVTRPLYPTESFCKNKINQHPLSFRLKNKNGHGLDTHFSKALMSHLPRKWFSSSSGQNFIFFFKKWADLSHRFSAKCLHTFRAISKVSLFHSLFHSQIIFCSSSIFSLTELDIDTLQCETKVNVSRRKLLVTMFPIVVFSQNLLTQLCIN